MTEQKQKRPTHNWAKDQDYWDKLSKEEKAWLVQFNNEYYHADFSKKKRPLHPEHYRIDCNYRSNSMKRDAMAIADPLNAEPVTLPQQDLKPEGA